MSGGKQPDATVGAGSLDPRMTFANFLVGRGNLLAHAAARHVAEVPPGAGVTCNPLFVYGAKGRGKTHLLQALAFEVQEQRRVHYLSGRDFPDRRIGLIEDIDVLIVDDLDLIPTKRQRSAFIALMNEMVDGRRQVVMSAMVKPSELLQFSEPAQRRIAGGLVVELADLDQELRLELLRHKAAVVTAATGRSAPGEDLLRALALRLPGSARDLDVALQHLFAAMSSSDEMRAGADADALIERVLGTLRQTNVEVDRIQTVVARYFATTKTKLLSKSRHSSIVRPRHIAMFLAKEMTEKSLPEIGRLFGKRDHTTVLHAIRKIEGLLPRDADLARQVDEIKRLLLERD